MTYRFMDILNSKRYKDGPFMRNEHIYVSPECFISIQAGMGFYSVPKINFMDISMYTQFELAIYKDSNMVTDFKNKRLRRLHNDYGFDGIFSYIPAEYVQEIFDILENDDVI